jgi:hypothetical protein
MTLHPEWYIGATVLFLILATIAFPVLDRWEEHLNRASSSPEEVQEEQPRPAAPPMPTSPGNRSEAETNAPVGPVKVGE